MTVYLCSLYKNGYEVIFLFIEMNLFHEKMKFSSVHSHRKNNGPIYIIFDSLIYVKIGIDMCIE